MADSRRRIERIIETDPVIRKGLQRGIVNSRALARYIQRSEGLDSTTDAILGIIRRYEVSDRKPSGLKQVFGECELSMRNRVANFQVDCRQETMNRMTDFTNNRWMDRGEITKVLFGAGLMTVISDRKALEAFLRTPRPGEMMRYSTDLAEISVRIPAEPPATDGITAKITMELVLNDIPLWGIMAFYWSNTKGEDSLLSHDENAGGLRELVLLVEETNGPRALEALQRMLKEEGAISKEGVTTSVPVSRQNRDPLIEPSLQLKATLSSDPRIR